MDLRDVRSGFSSSGVESKGKTNEFLVMLALDAATVAWNTKMTEISARIIGSQKTPDIYPGEHYRLLAGIVHECWPENIIEFQTGEGIGTLSLMKFMQYSRKIHTFDTIPWKENVSCLLTEDDFRDGRLNQHVGDISDDRVFEQHAELIRFADLIVIDSRKDGVTERNLLENLMKVKFEFPCVVLLDGIHFTKVGEVWNEISKPKLDVTSFGHWIGTGLIDMTDHEQEER